MSPTAHRNRFLLALALPIVLLLQGCPKPTAISLYNNSAGDLVVQYVDGKTEWRRGALLRLEDRELGRLVWVSVGKVRAPVLDVSNGQRTLRYPLAQVYSLPRDYVTTESVIEMQLQLEVDGFLYAARPGQQFPASALNPQPNEFPVAPIVL